MKTITYAVVPEHTLTKILKDLDFIKGNLDQKFQKKEWLSRKEFMNLCSIKPTKFYDLLKSGSIRSKKIGRRVYVHHTSIQKYFSQ